MQWRDPKTAPFSRIGVVSSVPSESGVFAIISGNAYLMVSDAWNLKARLLELINLLNAPDNLSVIYELCPDSDRPGRAQMLQNECIADSSLPPAASSAGITFWANPGAVGSVEV